MENEECTVITLPRLSLETTQFRKQCVYVFFSGSRLARVWSWPERVYGVEWRM